MIEAEEAEEVGVEHLLRGLPSATTGLLDTSIPTPATLDHLLGNKLHSLHALRTQLQDLHGYVQRVQRKELPLNHTANYELQNLFNTLPRVKEQVLIETGNDLAVGIAVSELIRAVNALHDCIDNKLAEQKAAAVNDS